MSRERVIVLGGGIAGLSTAYFLARSGEAEVTLIEREPRHDAHSTGRNAEILRVAVDDPVTRALALETADLLSRPASIGLDAGPLLDPCGLIILSEKDPAWYDELERAGVVTRVSAAFVGERAPHFLGAAGQAYWLKGGGRIQGARLVASLARGAQRAGATFLRSTGEAEMIATEAGVQGVRLPGGEVLEAERVVVAAGAWSGAMGKRLGAELPLRTTRRHMFVTGPDPSTGSDAPIVWDDTAGFYVRRQGPGWGISICDVADGGTDSGPLYPVDPGTQRRATRALASGMAAGPHGAPTIAHGWSGFRDLTPDDRPIVGPDPRLRGLDWCCGLGGHGMTLSLAVGRAAAGATLGRSTELAEQCSAARFEFVPA